MIPLLLKSGLEKLSYFSFRDYFEGQLVVEKSSWKDREAGKFLVEEKFPT